MKNCFWVLLMAIVLGGQASRAGQFPAQARVFVGSTSANPSDLNDEMNAQGFKEFKSITKYGAEITYPVARYLDAGIRYEKRYISNAEENPTPGTDYRTLLDQDSVLVIGRVPFWKNQYVRLDVFGGVGGSNTTLNIKSSTQDGELTRREGNDWFASLRTSAGASVAVGYKSVYLVIEGGYESNKVDSFKRTGTVNSNIETIDLSGGYVTVGLMFDGITATTR